MDPRAEAIFQQYRRHPEASAIASSCAIDGVMKTIDRYQPRRILEVGAGIGTLTAAILAARAPGVEVVSAEDNEVCRGVLAENLGRDFDRITLVRAPADVTGQFDLVVVDGEQVDEIMRFVAPRGLVIVEGDREPQREQLAASGRPYSELHVRTVRLMAADDPWAHRAVEQYQGGYYLFRFEPTPTERRQFNVEHYWYNNTIAWRRRLRRLARLA